MRHLARRILCFRRLYLLPSSTVRSLHRFRANLAAAMTTKHMMKGITTIVMGSIMMGRRVAYGF